MLTAVSNLLLLRVAGSGALVRFDGAFFDERLVPVLRGRGWTTSASARAPAEFIVRADDGALDAFLGGKVRVLAGRLEAPAGVWRSLAAVSDGRGQGAPSRVRDVGGERVWSTAASAPGDRVRGPGGRRVKGRARRASTAAGPPGAPTGVLPVPKPPPADPAGLAAASLIRCAQSVSGLVAAVAEDVVVVVVDGVVSADGAVLGRVPTGLQDRADGP
jgi:hypothetical protein